MRVDEPSCCIVLPTCVADCLLPSRKGVECIGEGLNGRHQSTSLEIGANDILVNYDVVSLFTKVPLQDIRQYMKDIFPEDIIHLFQGTF